MQREIKLIREVNLIGILAGAEQTVYIKKVQSKLVFPYNYSRASSEYDQLKYYKLFVRPGFSILKLFYIKRNIRLKSVLCLIFEAKDKNKNKKFKSKNKLVCCQN